MHALARSLGPLLPNLKEKMAADDRREAREHFWRGAARPHGREHAGAHAHQENAARGASLAMLPSDLCDKRGARLDGSLRLRARPRR